MKSTNFSGTFRYSYCTHMTFLLDQLFQDSWQRKRLKRQSRFFACTYLGKQNALASSSSDGLQDVLQLLASTAIGTVQRVQLKMCCSGDWGLCLHANFRVTTTCGLGECVCVLKIWHLLWSLYLISLSSYFPQHPAKIHNFVIRNISILYCIYWER